MRDLIEGNLRYGCVALFSTPSYHDTGISTTSERNFNQTTVASIQLPVASNLKLAVYDILGREVAVLVNEGKAAGMYEVQFDAKGLASGVYVYRLTSGIFVDSRKMLLMK